MKKLLSLLLVAALTLGLVACSRTPPSETKVCESADEFIENMGVGWNLGCTLSVYLDESALWRVGIYFLTPSGGYSRSSIIGFDPETMSASIVWKLDRESGTIWCPENSLIDRIGIELQNSSLDINDLITYRVDELTYVTADGEVVLEDAVGAQTTDMSDGNGGNVVASLENTSVETVSEIRAKVTFVEKTFGNTIENRPHKLESMWSSPATTPEMILAVRDRGFSTIRASVSWVNHMDKYGNIDPSWLERVADVVDYCMDAGVYCILNTSGAGWLTADPHGLEEKGAIYRRLWEQIAARFADYGELLLFESFNEILDEAGSWKNPAFDSFDAVHTLHQIFVDTVRASGGYNETRNLVLNPYAADPSYSMTRFFELPEDTVENHLIAQVHCYTPGKFTLNATNLGNNVVFACEWGTEAEKTTLDSIMSLIKKRFVDELGIPVLIGEFGVANRVSESERIEYLDFYVKTAKKYGIKLIVFDDGSDLAVFNRWNLTWPSEAIIDTLLQ